MSLFHLVPRPQKLTILRLPADDINIKYDDDDDTFLFTRLLECWTQYSVELNHECNTRNAHIRPKLKVLT